MEIATEIVLGTLLTALCLWAGMKLTGVDGSFFAMIIIAAISSLLTIIPVAGTVISTIVLFLLITKWTDANLFPDAVLMVIVAQAVGMFGALYLSQFVS